MCKRKSRCKWSCLPACVRACMSDMHLHVGPVVSVNAFEPMPSGRQRHGFSRMTEGVSLGSYCWLQLECRLVAAVTCPESYSATTDPASS
eukprot:GHVU01179112.1.p1 GENE.GHVU01179112.1~~GHVU01179112.1.p1  ORF type:complete len:101 (-),score=0.80 GHVU01179112.1:162-431(-)